MVEPKFQTEAETIIRAQQVEKFYSQPSENRIQVIAPTDLSIVPGEIVALLGPFRLGQVDPPANALRLVGSIGRRGLLAWQADWLRPDQCLDRLSEFRAYSRG